MNQVIASPSAGTVPPETSGLRTRFRGPSSSDSATAPTAPVARKYAGTLLTPGPEKGGWIAALGIAVVFATVVEWLSLVAPVPMGGDTGTWTALSYPFIGYPHPSEIVPFGYPPLLFPLLGFFVQVGGGPLVGARIYLAFVTLLLGLSTYVLGRSLFQFRVTALLAEALLFATVPFDRLFFFGGYPTLLALVFMNLALAFGVRYIRARQPIHAVYFWVATAATLLTHEFIGLALVVTLAGMSLFLLIKRQFPWSIVGSRAGAASAAFASLAVGAFYVGVRIAHVPQNNYLATNVLAHTRFAISAVLYPLRVQAFGGVIGYHLIKTASGSFAIATATALVIFFVMLAAAIYRPKYLTPSWIVVGSAILAVLAMAIGGWILNIYTDYRRFAYALYLPYILAGLLAFDTVFRWCSAPLDHSTTAVPPASEVSASSRSRLRRDSSARSRAPALTSIVAVCGAAIVIVAGGVYTYPGLVSFQHQYTGSLHSWQYVHAMESISDSGIPGSVLSLSGGATLHWTFAMTNRNVYSPTIVSGFVFKQSRVIDDQLAYFPFHYVLATSNGVQYVAIPGNTSEFFTGSPVFGALRFGTPTSIFTFPPDAFIVTLADGTVVPAYTAGGPLPSIMVTSGAVPSLVIRYVTPYYTLNVTSTSVPGGTTYVNSSASATTTVGLRELSTGIRQLPGFTNSPKTSVSGNSFVFNIGQSTFRSVITSGTVMAPATVALGSASVVNPASVNLKLDSLSTNPVGGSTNLSISTTLTVPASNSLGSDIPTVLSSAAILNNWDVRFVVLNNITRPLEQSIQQFFVLEFGATVYFQQSPWEVLLLPQPVP
jgi:hypothetical protein